MSKHNKSAHPNRPESEGRMDGIINIDGTGHTFQADRVYMDEQDGALSFSVPEPLTRTRINSKRFKCNSHRPPFRRVNTRWAGRVLKMLFTSTIKPVTAIQLTKARCRSPGASPLNSYSG